MNKLWRAATALAVVPLMIAAVAASPSAHAAQRGGPRAAIGIVLSPRTVGHPRSEIQSSAAFTFPAPGGSYMAAAYTQTDGFAILVTGDTSTDAEVNALAGCDYVASITKDCLGAGWVLNGWMALADYNVGSSSAPVILAWAVAQGHTSNAALLNAVSLCNAIAGVDACIYEGGMISPNYNASKPTKSGDQALGISDYPSYMSPPVVQDSITDPWKFLNRECTSFVAWRINDNDGVRFQNTLTGPNGKSATFGNADNWLTAATSIGYKYGPVKRAGVPGYTKTQPRRGAIAWWSDAAAPGSGHVAYVDAVKKNKAGQVIGVYIEQYNWEFAPGYTPGKYSHVYIPKGGKYQGEPYPTDFIYGFEGTQLITHVP